MPATPANTGGAGTGSLNTAKIEPASAPVKTDKTISLISHHPSASVQAASGKQLQSLHLRQTP